jgi:HEAT repeat protein
MTRTVDELIADLSSPDGILRDQALGMLVSYGRRATAALLALLDSDDRELRARASAGLGEIADPATADRLLQLLEDPDARVRSRSAWGLFRMRDARALDALLKTIDDCPDPTMVSSTLATDALIAIGQPALPRVADLLAAPSSETRGRARLVILSVAQHLPPAEAEAWRARVRAAEGG